MKDCNFRLLVGDAKHAVILIKYAYSVSPKLTFALHKTGVQRFEIAF